MVTKITENELYKVVEILRSGNHTCVIKTSDAVLTSNKSGIDPIIEWLVNGYHLKDAIVADKIIGKAAALLYVLADVKVIHADIMSERALVILNKYKITSYYDKLVPLIINRQGNGQCPMEEAVEDIDDPNLAYDVLKHKLFNINDRKLK